MFRTTLILAATLCAGAATAQEAGSGDPATSVGADQSQSPSETMITAEMLEEARVVALEGQYSEDVWQNRSPLSAMVADLREIGEVEHVVLNAEGQMQGVTTDVGGFLGIGQKHVLIPLEDLRVARPQEGSEDVTIVTRLNQQQLTDLAEFEMED